MSGAGCPGVDVFVRNEGSIWLVTPVTGGARAWIEESVSADAQRWGAALVVEHRYGPNLIQGMREAGLLVQGVR